MNLNHRKQFGLFFRVQGPSYLILAALKFIVHIFSFLLVSLMSGLFRSSFSFAFAHLALLSFFYPK